MQKEPQDPTIRKNPSIQPQKETLHADRMQTLRIKNQVYLNKDNLKKQSLLKQQLTFLTVDCKKMNKPHLTKSIEIWRSCKTLNELNLDLEGCLGIGQAFKAVCQSLTRLNCLRSLGLGFNVLRQLLNEEGSECLSETLKRIPSLEHLHLHLNSTNNLNAKVMEELERGLSSLPSFKHFHLTLFDQKVPESALYLLGKMLLRLKHLQTVKLDFSVCTEINAKGLAALGESLSRVGFLTGLNFIFHGCPKIEINGMRILHEKVSQSHSLKSLGMKFQLMDFKIQQFGYLHFELKTLSSIKKMSIDPQKPGKLTVLYLACFNQGSIEQPFESLKTKIQRDLEDKDISLENLGISLRHCKIPTRILDLNLSLFEVTHKNKESLLSKLRSLEKLYDSYLIEPHPLESMKRTSKFSSLSSLGPLDSFKQSAPNFKLPSFKPLISNLELPNLSFWKQIQAVENQGFANLNKKIKKMTQLNALRIDLSKCHFMTFDGLKCLIEGSKNLNQLKVLRFLMKSESSWERLKDDFGEQLHSLVRTQKLLKEKINSLYSNKAIDWSQKEKHVETFNRINDLSNNLHGKIFTPFFLGPKPKTLLRYRILIDEIIVSQLKLSEKLQELGKLIHTSSVYMRSNLPTALLQEEISQIAQEMEKTRPFTESEWQVLLDDHDKYLKIKEEESAHKEYLGFASLNTFNLSLEGIYAFDDEDLKYLSETIKQTPSLRTISLSFPQCHQITILGLQSLSSALESLKDLESLTLHFGKCWVSMCPLIEGIKETFKHLAVCEVTMSN